MIAEGQDGSVISLVERGLLRGSEDGERTTTSLSMSSLEGGGTEDVHEELKRQEEKIIPIYIPNETANAGPGNNWGQLIS
jgi:hypothetical protein